MKKKGLKIFSIVLAVVMIACLGVCLIACSGKAQDKSRNGYTNGSSGSPSAEGTAAEDSVGNRIVTTTDRMIVYTVDLSMSVKKQRESLAEIKTKVAEYGGYETNSYSSETSGYMRLTVKIPTEKLDEFLSSIEGKGEVHDKSVSSYDVTESYYTALRKKEALEDEKARLEAELETGELTLDQKLIVYKSLSDIAEKIGAYEDDLAQYKKDVDYSTVYITLYEEGTYEEPSYWDSLGEMLFGSGRSVGVVFGWILKILVAILPYVGILAGAFGLYVLIKFIVCKARKKPFALFKNARERHKKHKAQKEAVREKLKQKNEE